MNMFIRVSKLLVDSVSYPFIKRGYSSVDIWEALHSMTLAISRGNHAYQVVPV